MHLHTLTPNLAVDDVQATIDWYEKLGFNLEMTVPDKGPFDWAMVKMGEIELMFQRTGSLQDEIPGLGQPGGGFTLFIRMTGVQEMRDKADALDAIVVDLHKTFYQATEVAIKDPSGYHLVFAEFDDAE